MHELESNCFLEQILNPLALLVDIVDSLSVVNKKDLYHFRNPIILVAFWLRGIMSSVFSFHDGIQIFCKSIWKKRLN